MAEKKNTTSKKTATEKVSKSASKKTTAKKTTKPAAKKTVKKEVKKAPVKKVEETKKQVSERKVVDMHEAKLKEIKKDSKFKKWFNKLTLEQIVIGGVIIIALLLIVLIAVASKDTKTKNGDDIVVKVDGKTITANDLYKELKSQSGQTIAINLIDEYILDKEYKTTKEMKESAKATIESYKNNYGDNFEAFLQYNGIENEKALNNLLIKNSKLSTVTEDYIKSNITEKEMKKYYEEKIVGDIEAKHILISYEEDESKTDEENKAAKEKAKKKAEKIIKKLQDGEDFDALAKKYSDDKSSKENGGSLGYFNTGDMVAEFEAAAYALDVNQYTTKPVETKYGYHIIMKTNQKEKPSYKKAKETVKEKMIEEQKKNDASISAKAMIALRKKYNIKIKDKAVKSDYNDYVKESTKTTTTAASEE